jgi:uncharacterized membrane protein YciS (DUF1049 family)
MAESKNLTLKDAQKHIITTTISAVIGAILSGIIIAAGFYYKTTIKIDEHSVSIEKLTKSLDDVAVVISDLKTKQAISQSFPIEQQRQIDDIKKSVDKLDGKVDKIYDALLLLKNKK